VPELKHEYFQCVRYRLTGSMPDYVKKSDNLAQTCASNRRLHRLPRLEARILAHRDRTCGTPQPERTPRAARVPPVQSALSGLRRGRPATGSAASAHPWARRVDGAAAATMKAADVPGASPAPSQRVLARLLVGTGRRPRRTTRAAPRARRRTPAAPSPLRRSRSRPPGAAGRP